MCLSVVVPAMQSALSCVDVLASFAAFSQSQMGATCRPVLLPPGSKHPPIFIFHFISFISCLTVWGVEPDVTLSGTHNNPGLVSSIALKQLICLTDRRLAQLVMLHDILLVTLHMINASVNVVTQAW